MSLIDTYIYSIIGILYIFNGMTLEEFPDKGIHHYYSTFTGSSSQCDDIRMVTDVHAGNDKCQFEDDIIYIE